MSVSKKRALILGATGVVGRYLLQYLCEQPDWGVVAASRRTPEARGKFEHVAVNLLNPEECAQKLAAYPDITHVFYAAFLQDSEPASHIARNTAMLVNAVSAIELVSTKLAHVHLVEGTKWYGSHLGPFRTPAKESDARHQGGNFYHEQQDWLEARQRGKSWAWSAVRPHAVCGFSVGSPMNLALVLAVYAVICRELSIPFVHPGAPQNFRALYQLTDATLLAQAMTWMATQPRCANQAFNVTNGDLIRWENLWPRIAQFFNVSSGPQRQFSLREFMSDKATVWDSIVAKHRLQPHAFAQIAGWGFGDFVFGSTWDIISDVGKARRFGFYETADSEDMLFRLFQEFRANRIIPE